MQLREHESRGIHKSTDLAIVGIGCMFPDANGVSEFWKNIRAGRDSIKPIPATHWKPSDYFHSDQKAPDMTYAKTGGFISPYQFNPMEYGISPNAIEATDTTQLLGMVVAHEALKDAGYGVGRDFNRDRVSCVIGVTGTLELVIPLGARLGHPIWRKALADAGVATDVAEDVVQRISESYVGWQENSFPGLLGNVVAGRIANRLNLGGTNCVVDAACASSLSALHLACLELAAGKSDMVVTGGFDTFNDIFMYMCFSKTPALSPTGQSRPFDRDGDGTILGEGLGAILIKRLPDAKRDGDRIYAVVKGIGTSSDGKGQAIYAPSSAGQAKCLRDAYARAEVSPATIELIEAHGTGTKVGDAVEAKALKEVFAESDAGIATCAVGSVKSQIGHTKAAAGAAGLIKATLALYHKVLPPTIKVKSPNESLAGSALYLNSAAKPWVGNTLHPRRAGVSAFGFGGSNFHCVLEEYAPEKLESDWDGSVQIIPFAADSVQALQSLVLSSLGGFANWATVRRESRRLRTEFTAASEHRFVLVLTEGDDIPAIVGQVKAEFARAESKRSWQVGNFGYYGSGEISGLTALVFPGQGAQRVGMLADLGCTFPEMLRALSQGQAVQNEIQHCGPKALSLAMYPPTPFDSGSASQNEARLQKTDVAQPAIAAATAGALAVVRSFGLDAEMSAGHSFGELSALYCAGAMSEETYLRLAAVRGLLMARASGANSGSMLAVRGDRETVSKVVKDSKLNVVVANHNAPMQVVLSGARDQLKQAEAILAAAGMGTVNLPVGAAFHSPIVADAEKPFDEYLARCEFLMPSHPVFSNETAREYPSSPDEIRQRLSQHLVNPVSFVDEIQNMYLAGARRFVEIGPGKILSDLVSKILGDKDDIEVVALDSHPTNSRPLVGLAHLLARISAKGSSLRLNRWDETYVEPPIDKAAGFTVEISGANVFKERPKPRPAVKSNNTKVALGPQNNSEINPSIARVETQRKQEASSVTNNKNLVAVPDVSSSLNANPLFQLTQQNLLSLQNLQRQTAELHQQFLTNQQSSQEMFQTLLRQQFDLLAGIASPVQSPSRSHMASAEAVVSPSPVAANIGTLVQAPVATSRHDRAQTPNQATPGANRSAPDDAALRARILQVVADKTGYPADMLDLAMNLENDLGIDSIKRVEIFSALHSEFGLNKDLRSDELGALSTLQDIVNKFAVSGGVATGPADQTAAKSQGPSAILSTETSNRSSEILFAIIAEKTGYPVEMLTLDMDLESDLGIDSIKRVEILSAVQEKNTAAKSISAERLNSARTVREILELLAPAATVESGDASNLGRSGGATVANPVADRRANESGSTEIADRLFAVVAEKTGYPVDMLAATMHLESDLGIDSIKKVEIFSALQTAMPGFRQVDQEVLSRFDTLASIIDHYSRPAAPTAAVDVLSGTSVGAEKKNFPAEDSVERLAVVIRPIADDAGTVAVPPSGDRLVWVTGCDFEQAEPYLAAFSSLGFRSRFVEIASCGKEPLPTDLAGMLVLAPSVDGDPANESFLFASLVAAQNYRKNLLPCDGVIRRFFATLTFNGGAFGLAGLNSESDPIAAGLAGLSKSAGHEWSDVLCKALDADPALSAVEIAARVAKQCITTNSTEIGLQCGQTVKVDCERHPFSPGLRAAPFGTDDLVVITGGARGVTAEIAVAMAENYRCKLLLLGRSPLPDPEPHWLLGVSDHGAMKKAIIKNLDQQLTLKDVEIKFQQILAWREMDANFERIRAAGSKFLYRSVDIQDAERVREIIQDAEFDLGPVTGIVHGAGVLRDRAIVDKTEEQFKAVYGTKVRGLSSLLGSIDCKNLKCLVLFSSSTGRYGRKGQVDYAMANEVLNKIADQLSNELPNCRVLAANWGPWDGGMVNDGLKKVFSSEGIGLISLQAGARYLIEELKQTGTDALVETVVLGTKGTENAFSRLQSSDELLKAFSRDVSVETHPFLSSHVLKGRGVVPAAVLIEWLAQAALQHFPGLVFSGFDDFRILKGITLDRSDTIQLMAFAGTGSPLADGLAVRAELRSAGAGNRSILHAAATVLLTNEILPEQEPVISEKQEHYGLTVGDAYEKNLFHGPEFQGLYRVIGCSKSGISGVALAGARPSEWMIEPQRGSWLTEPVVVDVSFQLMILWSIEQAGIGCLPTAIRKYRQFRRAFPKTHTVIHIAAHKGKSVQSVEADIEFLDSTGQLIARIDHYEGVRDRSLVQAFAENTLSASPLGASSEVGV